MDPDSASSLENHVKIDSPTYVYFFPFSLTSSMYIFAFKEHLVSDVIFLKIVLLTIARSWEGSGSVKNLTDPKHCCLHYITFRKIYSGKTILLTL
jgi:hypothetical protein